MIANIKEIINDEEKRIISITKEHNLNPKLAVIVANDLESSKRYISNKKKETEKLGFICEEYRFKKDSTEEEIIEQIELLNDNNNIHGIIVQLPLYDHLNEDKILNTVNSRKDIDGFTYENLGKIMSGKEGIIPCTPKGILLILEKLQVDVAKKNIVILGRSKIVGRPIAELLISRGATVTVCNSNTQNIEEYTKNADILIVAIGKPLYINKKMVKENSVVIDVGINSYNGKIVGDVDTLDIADYVRYVTPVPGGVGLTTVISLMDNLVKLAMENKN